MIRVVRILAQGKTCSPTCPAFKCTQNAAVYRRDGVWCRWTDDICDVANCRYAICVRRRLLPGGICGETVKRKTVEKPPEEVVGPAIKLRGRALRKIGEKEIF
ncbi:hypothetical protein C0195_02240 [Candidatus Bathyarchaeota archaeon]|nr:MAG: hypothetical protein C0195_02240 [Candidatus Bathyarchaeota archaeon]